MATGRLWQIVGEPRASIPVGLRAYVIKYHHSPACVRVSAATLGEPRLERIDGVRVILDKTIQPGHYMMCETLEEEQHERV